MTDGSNESLARNLLSFSDSVGLAHARAARKARADATGGSQITLSRDQATSLASYIVRTIHNKKTWSSVDDHNQATLAPGKTAASRQPRIHPRRTRVRRYF